MPLPAAYRAVSIVAPTVGIQLVVLEVVIDAAMPLVTAGFSRSHQNAAGGSAILGREAVGNESDFANGLLRRSIGVVESRIIPRVLPVEEDCARIGPAAVHDRTGSRIARGDHARRQGHQRVRAAVGGKLDDLSSTRNIAQRRTYLVDLHRVCSDRDLFVDAARLQSNVNGRDLSDQYRHVSHAVQGKTIFLDGQIILSSRQIRNLVVPVIGSFRYGNGPGRLAGGGYFRLWHRSSSWIHHRSGDSALLHLGKANKRIRSQKQRSYQQPDFVRHALISPLSDSQCRPGFS